MHLLKLHIHVARTFLASSTGSSFLPNPNILLARGEREAQGYKGVDLGGSKHALDGMESLLP